MSQPPLGNPPQSPLRLHRELQAVSSIKSGLRGWCSSVSHGDIGMRFMLTSIFFFGVAGLLSMLIRAQLATRDGAFLDVAQYNQFFTMHGTLMMFLFATPMFEGLAMYLLPRILGARDMAFPRLSALGWWCYLFGGVILLVALITGLAPDGGWFMYVPLSSKTYSPGVNADVWLLGITFIEISAIAAAVEIVATILYMRAPYMRLTQMPLMAWYLLGAAAMMLVGFPPLILGSLLLELERAFDWPFFDVARGGDALLWQHLFWLFGHPEVYIIFLPAAGAISTILPVMAGTKILGYRAIVGSIMGLVFLSFGLWVHHMFTVGIPHMALAFFSAASALVAVPTAVQMFLWIGTLWKGRPQLKLPMLYLMGFFSTFVMGGLTGVMLAVVPFNWQAHDTAFVTAHLHYVLIGGFVFPMMAALIYWMPFMTGRMAIPRLGAWAFWTIFIGFHGTFFLMHLTGLLGMPRRIATYNANPEWELLNLSSSLFGFVMTAGFALFAISLILQAFIGDRAPRNPWKADGMEWKIPLFAKRYNFASLPLSQEQDRLSLARGEGLLPGAPRGLAETLIVDPLTGVPKAIVALPRPTLLPLWTSLVIGGFVLLMLISQYLLAAITLIAIALACWQWGNPYHHRPVPQEGEVAPNLRLPFEFLKEGSIAHIGMICFLVANAALFMSYLFGIGFIGVVAADPVPKMSSMGLPSLIIALGVLLLLAVAAFFAKGHQIGAGLAANGLVIGLCLMLTVLVDDPQLHARFALIAFGLGYIALHAIVAALLAAHGLRQKRRGVLSVDRPGILPIWSLWQNYTLMTALALGGVLALTWVSV